MSVAITITGHEVIRNWAEARDGHPARVRAPEKPASRESPPSRHESPEPIGREDFFELFESRRLAFLHQDLTEHGQTSRFNRLADRDGN